MDRNSFVNETLEILDKIKHNVIKSGFMLADDALKLITVAQNTIENYSIDYSELNNEYINSLSENSFQELLYSICKIKYPELNELWFKIDGNDLSIDITYRNKINI